MTTNGPARRGYLIALAAVVTSVLVLLAVQAGRGALDRARAAALGAILVTVVGVGAVVVLVAPLLRLAGAMLLLLALAGLGAGAVAPLYRRAHPPAPLARETLAGGRREVILPGPPRAGTWELALDAAPGATYALAVTAGTRTERVEGSDHALYALSLAKGERLALTLERADGPVTVTLRAPHASRVPSRWAALVAVLAALLVDALAVQKRRRGLVSLAVAAPVLYALVLEGARDVGAGTVFGAALLALVGAGLWAVLAALASALSALRRPRRGGARRPLPRS